MLSLNLRTAVSFVIWSLVGLHFWRGEAGIEVVFGSSFSITGGVAWLFGLLLILLSRAVYFTNLPGLIKMVVSIVLGVCSWLPGGLLWLSIQGVGFRPDGLVSRLGIIFKLHYPQEIHRQVWTEAFTTGLDKLPLGGVEDLFELGATLAETRDNARLARQAYLTLMEVIPPPEVAASFNWGYLGFAILGVALMGALFFYLGGGDDPAGGGGSPTPPPSPSLKWYDSVAAKQSFGIEEVEKLFQNHAAKVAAQAAAVTAVDALFGGGGGEPVTRPAGVMTPLDSFPDLPTPVEDPHDKNLSPGIKKVYDWLITDVYPPERESPAFGKPYVFLDTLVEPTPAVEKPSLPPRETAPAPLVEPTPAVEKPDTPAQKTAPVPSFDPFQDYFDPRERGKINIFKKWHAVRLTTGRALEDCDLEYEAFTVWLRQLDAKARIFKKWHTIRVATHQALEDGDLEYQAFEVWLRRQVNTTTTTNDEN